MLREGLSDRGEYNGVLDECVVKSCVERKGVDKGM